MLRLLTICLLLSGSIMPSFAQPVRDIEYLSSIDEPITLELVMTHQDQRPWVAHLARDPAQKVYVSARSIAWLAIEGSPESYEVVAHLLEFDPDPLVRRQAFISLTRVLVKRYPGRVEQLLLSILPELDTPLFRAAVHQTQILNHERTHQR